MLFHGIYARMYSLFLFLSTLSYLALLRALERGGARAPGSSGAVDDAADDRRAPVRRARPRLAGAVRPRHARAAAPGDPRVRAVACSRSRSGGAASCSPNRFDVGVGGSGGGLRTPHRSSRTSGTSRATRRPATPACSSSCSCSPLVGLACLARDAPEAALLIACVVLTPTLFFLVGRFGGSSAPQSRHLIFVLPFLALAAGGGIVGLARLPGRAAPGSPRPSSPRSLSGGGRVGLAQDAGALRQREPRARHGPRAGGRVARAPPRARTTCSSPTSRSTSPPGSATARRSRTSSSPAPTRSSRSQALRGGEKPLGRGVWVFDAGDNNNYVKRTAGRAPAAVPAQRVRGPRVRPVPRDPHAQADAHDRALPRRRPQGRADRQVARRWATPTSTTRRSAALRSGEVVRSRSSVSS